MIVLVRHDRCLDILDIVDEAEVAQALERLRTLPLAGRVPYKVRFDGKWWTFEATYKWPLIGVCQPNRDGTVLLLSSVGAGLMITGIEEDAEESRYKEDWRATFDLDADEADGGDEDAGTNAHARAAEPARVSTAKVVDRVEAARRARRSTTSTTAAPPPGWSTAPAPPSAPSPVCASTCDDVQAARGTKRHPPSPGPAEPIDKAGDDVEAEYARLGCGRGAHVALEAFRLYLDQVGRQATAPHPRRPDCDKARVHALALLAGLLTAAANGCLRLCGREQAIRKQLAVYGVDLPERSVAPVLRLLCELGCIFVWQPPPAKGHGFSKRYVVEVGEAINPEHPTHLAMLRATQPVFSEARTRTTRQVRNASEPVTACELVAAREPATEPTAAPGPARAERGVPPPPPSVDPEDPMHLAMPRRGVLRDDGASAESEAAARTASGSPPGRPAGRGPTYREFLQLAVGVMLVLGREVLEAHELAVASLTAAQAAGSASPGVAAPGPLPTEGEVPPPPSVSPELPLHVAERGPTSKAGQADAAGGQGVGQRWLFAAAISSAQLDIAAAGPWAEAVDGAWHALAWPLPHVATSPVDLDPPLNGDMLIEARRPSRTDETRWLRWPASVRVVVPPVGGVGNAPPRNETRPWLDPHVKHNGAEPRGPPRRRPSP